MQPFTPYAPSRPDENILKSKGMPSGPASSILFPQSNVGKSPLLASASPAHVPFTGPATTPADPLLAPRTGGTTARTPSTAFTPGVGLTPALLPAARPSLGGAGTMPFGAASVQRPAPLRAAAADDRPPITSLFDVGGSSAAPNLNAAAPTTTAAASLASAATAFATASATTTNGTTSSDLWVTAFGFHGTSMLPLVLEELRPSGGEIRQHTLGSGQWVHVRYADWRQQQQALAKNGKVVHGMMLGVVEGLHPSADGLDAASASTAGGGVPGGAIPLRVQQPRHVGPALRPPPIAIADLGKASWWTRLCEYVFGW